MDSSAEKTLQAQAATGRGEGNHPLRDQAGRVATEVRELGQVAAHSTGEAIDHARDKGGEVIAATRRETRKVREQVEDLVRDNPLGALACAAGAGALLVIFMKR